MKAINIILCAGLIIGTLTGCTSGQPEPVETTSVEEAPEYSVVGNWSGKDSDKTVYYNFTEDQTYTSGQLNDKSEKTNEVSGTYSFSEDTLTLTEKDKESQKCQVLFENDDVMTLVINEGKSGKEKIETKEDKEDKEEKKTAETKKIRLVKQVSKRKVTFINGTDLNITEVVVKSEKDKEYSSNLVTSRGDTELFNYDFDTGLKYEIKVKSKARKSKVVSSGKKDEKQEEDKEEDKEYTIKDFNAADINEASIKLKNDICYVEYVSLTSGEKKDTYVEPKKEEPKPAAPSGEKIDTSMAGTYYLQSNMNVRTGAGYNAGVITVYSSGTTVNIVGTITNSDGSIWAKLTDGTYICFRDGNGQYLGKTPPSGGGASAGTYVTLYEMNIRTGPSTSSASVGVIPAGTVFDVYRIEYGSDGSVWLVPSRTEPGLDSYICYQNSAGTYCAPY
ncbi:MAG: hypothetical protein J6E46_05190 [Faecalicoccus sp.]|nr:hypothetical protein [Faecalicoccus sp.]